MQIEKQVFLLTGSNVEPRVEYLKNAEKKIATQIGNIIRKSLIYESEPWGFQAEISFLNQVLVVMTQLSAIDVLQRVQYIEMQLGRRRMGNSYLSRTIDIDILYFENEIIEVDELSIPHPRLHERKFTMIPLAEVAGDFFHPVLKKSNTEILQLLTDTGWVWKYSEE